MQYVIFNIPVFLILSVRDGFEVDLQWTATVEDSNILPAIFCGQPAFCNWYKHKHRDRPHTQKTHTHTWHACVHTTSTDLTQLNIDYNRWIQFWIIFFCLSRELRNYEIPIRAPRKIKNKSVSRQQSGQTNLSDLCWTTSSL